MTEALLQHTFRCEHHDRPVLGCAVTCECGHRCDDHPLGECARCPCQVFKNDAWGPDPLGRPCRTEGCKGDRGHHGPCEGAADWWRRLAEAWG